MRVFNHNIKGEKARRDPKMGNQAVVGCELEAQEFPSPPGALVEGHMVGTHLDLSSVSRAQVCSRKPNILERGLRA